MYTNQTHLDKTLYVSIMILTLIGISKGTLISLGISLLVIFIFGSYMIWLQFHFANSIVTESEMAMEPFFTIKDMFVWQIAFLISSFVSGHFHHQKELLIKKYRYWEKQFNQLVTIDSVTAFDNKRRFFLQLKTEFKRAESYQQHFTLLLMKIKNWEAFKRLYGNEEATHLLQYFSGELRKMLRESDSRFRITEDTFAFILPETPKSDVEKIIKNLVENNSDFSLKSKDRLITLHFEFGYILYDEQLEDDMRMYNDALDELNSYVD